MKVNETGKEIFNTILVKNIKYRRFDKHICQIGKYIILKKNGERRVYIYMQSVNKSFKALLQQ